MIINLSIGRYRSISEPFAYLLHSNNVQTNNIIDSEQLQFSHEESTTKTELRSSSEIIAYLTNHFSAIFTNPVNVVQSHDSIDAATGDAILAAYNGILSGKIDEQTWQEINERISTYEKNNNTATAVARTAFTIHEFLLYEAALALQHFDRSTLEKFPAIEDLIAQFETNQSLQPFLFSAENLLKPFSASVDNRYRSIADIVNKNIHTLAEFAHLENAMYKYKHDSLIAPDHIPFSPSAVIIKKKEFQDFYEKTQLWNKLLFKMTQNLDWLNQQFENMNDPFLQGFLKIAEKARHSTTTSKYSLGIIRNDVMHSASKHKWLQVEINTISVSFGYIAEQVQSLQKTIKNSYLKNHFPEYECLSASSIGVIVQGLAKAHNVYNRDNAQVLIVVSSFEGNEYDQRYPEYLLARDHGILSKRRTFDDLMVSANVDESGRLFVEGDEISVIYFRTGYSPEHLPDEKAWAIREKIELTQAIKCPSVNLVLAGFKKLQKVLQQEGEMERFLTPEECAQLKSNFASISDFEDESKHEELIQAAANRPAEYVLKPQREGGDNNTYGTAIATSLAAMTPQERKNYILMERIVSKPNIALMVRQRVCQVYPSVSELGVISCYLADDKEVQYNQPGGYLVRTKRYFDNEGGVNAGYSVIDGLMVKKAN